MPTEELIPSEWQDEELAEELGIQFEPSWKQVEISLLGDVMSLQAACVVSPWLHQETGEEVGRYLTIIGKSVGEEEGYELIGTMFPGRREGDDPYLMLNNGSSDSDIHNYAPMESADAALFISLADQILPQSN